MENFATWKRTPSSAFPEQFRSWPYFKSFLQIFPTVSTLWVALLEERICPLFYPNCLSSILSGGKPRATLYTIFASCSPSSTDEATQNSWGHSWKSPTVRMKRWKSPNRADLLRNGGRFFTKGVSSSIAITVRTSGERQLSFESRALAIVYSSNETMKKTTAPRRAVSAHQIAFQNRQYDATQRSTC